MRHDPVGPPLSPTNRRKRGFYFRVHVAEWYTRSVEVAVGEIPWRFKSSHEHPVGEDVALRVMRTQQASGRENPSPGRLRGLNSPITLRSEMDITHPSEGWNVGSNPAEEIGFREMVCFLVGEMRKIELYSRVSGGT